MDAAYVRPHTAVVMDLTPGPFFPMLHTVIQQTGSDVSMKEVGREAQAIGVLLRKICCSYKNGVNNHALIMITA